MTNQYVKIENFLPHDEFFEILDHVRCNSFDESSKLSIINTFRSMVPVIVKSLGINVICVGDVNCWITGSTNHYEGIIHFFYSLDNGVVFFERWVNCLQNSLIAYPSNLIPPKRIFGYNTRVEGCFQAFDPETYQPSLLIPA